MRVQRSLCQMPDTLYLEVSDRKNGSSYFLCLQLSLFTHFLSNQDTYQQYINWESGGLYRLTDFSFSLLISFPTQGTEIQDKLQNVTVNWFAMLSPIL